MIIKPESNIYKVLSGKYEGKLCVIRGKEKNRSVGIMFMDLSNPMQLVYIRKGRLAKLETPGWPEINRGVSYGLREYFRHHKGAGVNMLRTTDIAQPQALRAQDEIANGEKVLENPRIGCNSSVLIKLSNYNWVEVAPRLPIALRGNVNFKFPIELSENDKLTTGCNVIRNSISLTDVGWVRIFLDKNTCLDVPACIPLALE
ncbi:MAG: hypothetical protein Q7U36_03190 [bacterium]|nr:hypothetical protein [bacterium]